jgi:hypothetical protein
MYPDIPQNGWQQGLISIWHCSSLLWLWHWTLLGGHRTCWADLLFSYILVMSLHRTCARRNTTLHPVCNVPSSLSTTRTLFFLYGMSCVQILTSRLILILVLVVMRGITQTLQENTGMDSYVKRQEPRPFFFKFIIR